MKLLQKTLAAFIVGILITVTYGVSVFASEVDNNIEQNQTTVSEASGNDKEEDKDNKVVQSENIKQSTEKMDDTKTVDKTSKEETKKEDTKKEDTKKEDTKKEDTKKEDTKKEDSKKDSNKAVAPKKYSEKELRLLASLIYSEAGNQSYKGMLAVANVVINRSKSKVYWHVDTIKEVVYDRKWGVQFSVTIKSKSTGLSPLDKALKSYDTGKFNTSNPGVSKKNMEKAIKAAKAALQGENNIGGYLCFTNKRNTQSIQKKYSYVIIGDHIFYRTK